MVTIGRGILDEAVWGLFEGLRTFDAGRATAHLADDVDWEDPWSDAPLAGKDAVQAHLEVFLGDLQSRPSWTIADVSGDGAITRLTLSVSRRFGASPERYRLVALSLKGTIHQVVIEPAPKKK